MSVPPVRDENLRETRGYQQEMLDESLRRNIIIALDTGSGKTRIAILRMKQEIETEPRKVTWFFAPTVALCKQQEGEIQKLIPCPIGRVSGANEPGQWKDSTMWDRMLSKHRIIVSTPQVLLDALRHGYVNMGSHISLLVFDEAHHALDKHPYNRIMQEFYFDLPPRTAGVAVGPIRPMILGLTASPIYGGDAEKAFGIIERNLDSTIRTTRRFQHELDQYVHRPVFKNVPYDPSDPENPLFSTNLAALDDIIAQLDIEQDPYVISLRGQLAKATPFTDTYKRLDQKLSKVISKRDSFTHKGLADFQRTASDICQDIGPWAADWFIDRVLAKAKHAANPYNNVMVTWKNQEKRYLLSILNRLVTLPASYFPDDITDDCSNKLNKLIDCLLEEKREAEELDERYSGIIFVQRRDAVLALAEVLEHHPRTKGVFNIGMLIGSSESAYRHAMMDITRNLLKKSRADNEPETSKEASTHEQSTLDDFKIGATNLLISTSVAEEGIDVQACCSVIRWDPPPNMASWVQSRGRARKERSTFTLLYEKDSPQSRDVEKWKLMEQRMIQLYNDPSRDMAAAPQEDMADDVLDDDLQFTIPSTGAVLTLHSAVSHLAHFCAVIPNSAHVDNAPIYELDPPRFPEGWHSFDGRNQALPPSLPPFGSQVTLPRTLPLPERKFVVPREFRTIASAHRHAAYKAYLSLYEANLLNDYLLPITSILEPELEQDVISMLADVEKRAGMANIPLSVDAWAPVDASADVWFASEMFLEGLPPLTMFTLTEIVPLDAGTGGPILYRRGHQPIRVTIVPHGPAQASHATIEKARTYTRNLFWSLNHTKIDWDKTDFSYLFLPQDYADSALWDSRREWIHARNLDGANRKDIHLMVNADSFGRQYDYPSDISLVQRHFGMGRPFKFVRWRYEQLSEEEELELLETYKKHPDPVEISYPLLVVKAFPPRSNFLIPTPASTWEVDQDAESEPVINLIPKLSGVIGLSGLETTFAFLLPSVLRSIGISLTSHSLRQSFFSNEEYFPLSQVPLPLLTIAITAPSSGEQFNYQRMETLGDTVLKFVASLQVLAEYPLWHEGYLTRKKDHSVSNVRLAKEDLKRGLYRWIIRDILLGKKWRPKYQVEDLDPQATGPITPSEAPPNEMDVDDSKKSKKRKKKKNQVLSTKVLADVVESMIGAAYLHGGLDLGYQCAKFFDLGLKWAPIQDRVDQLLSRVEIDAGDYPSTLTQVEAMLGYTFERKLLLIEALTHASYQQDSRTPSYERMEFMGDSVLDMIVNDFLYRAPGKNYSPGHIHLRKSAVVNGHILAYICLKTSVTVTVEMPEPNSQGVIEIVADDQELPLWRCLLHSSHKVMEDQQNTFVRFRKYRRDIDEALETGSFFPWAALTRLQAPKFLSDMVESIVGAIYLDSHGDLDIIRGVLRKLGIMRILSRIVEADVDVLHPVSRLSLWAQKHGKEVQYEYKTAKGNVTCSILLDGVEEIQETHPYRGLASQEEVKFAAAEKAIKVFKLRDANTSHKPSKKSTQPKGKSRKGKERVSGN